jgi:hypothetical protein
VPEPKMPFRDGLTSAVSELAAEMRCRINRWLGAATGFSLPRERMVRDQLVCRGIRNTEILSAMRATPRHLFIPAELRFLAYGDFPVSIGYGGHNLSAVHSHTHDRVAGARGGATRA